MIRLLLIVTVFLTATRAFAQGGLVNSSPFMVESFSTEPAEDLILLPMDFDSDAWRKISVEVLSDKQILIVSLVYTRFRTSDSFDQVALNRNRLKKLQARLPFLFEDRTILWRLVEQTKGETRTEALQLFHGFAINARPLPSKELKETELKNLSKLKETLSAPEGSSSLDKESEVTDGEKAAYFMEEGSFRTFDRPATFVGNDEALHYFLASNLTYPIKAQVDSIEGTVMLSFEVAPNGDVRGVRTVATVSSELDAEAERVLKKSPKWLPAKFNGVPVASNYTIPVVFDLDGDGKAKTGKTKSASTPFIPFGKDQTVSAVLNRNNWKKMAIVCDLTGSMSSYTKQLLVWFGKNMQNPNLHSFTFFNDGDERNNSGKRIGKTGGIYQTHSHDLDTVFDMITTTMNNGSGGDIPENNLEAVLMAQADCPDCDIVMIADNFATPRDLKLSEDINSPLHIIPCGSQLGLNLNYLMLAYQCGGSLHTLGSDLPYLHKTKDGGIIQIGNEKYQLNNGRFVRFR
ncbi:MAG: TonB family protein [Granulosicoccus sp.]|jgi:TonB family protein